MNLLSGIKNLYKKASDKISDFFSYSFSVDNEEEKKQDTFKTDVPIVKDSLIDTTVAGQDRAKSIPGMNLPQRFNNPGALEFAGQEGARRNGRFAEFTDYASGRKALENDLSIKFNGQSKTKLTPDSSIRDFVSVYAPQNENDIDFYTKMLTDKLGAKADDKIGTFKDRVSDFADVIEVVEGYRSPAQYAENIAKNKIKEEETAIANTEFEEKDKLLKKYFFNPEKRVGRDFVISALQAIPRSVLTLALSSPLGKLLGEDREIRPEEDFGDVSTKLIGNEPIRPLFETGRDFLQGFGASDDTAKRYALPIGIALTASDLWPSLKTGKKAFLETLSKIDDVGETLKLLKSESGLTDDILQPIAETISKLKNVDEIDNVLAQNAIDIVKKGQDVTSGVGRKFNTLKESFKQGVNNALRRDEMARAFDNYSNIPPETSKPTGLFNKLKQSLVPLKYVDEKTNEIFTNWSRKVSRSKVIADEAIANVPDLPGEAGLNTILKYESGKFTPFNSSLKEVFDDFYKEGVERGLNIEYRANYLPQVYANTPEQVKVAVGKYMKDIGVEDDLIKAYLEGVQELPTEISRRLGINPFFTKERVFPDYMTAMKYGLKPKYNNPFHLIAHYKEQLERSIANRELLDQLAFDGKILPLEIAPRSWKAVEFPFSPKGYYAEPKVADLINGLFRDESNLGVGSELAKFTAGISRKAQEIALSAGVPMTQINFFSIGQLVKEMTSGNFKSIVPFLRSNFNSKSIAYFKANQDVMRRMAENGIDLGGTIARYDNLYKNLGDMNWKEIAGRKFDKLFNEKVFGSFMPQLYIQTFKDAELKFLQKGLSAIEASTKASEVVKNAFGLMDFAGRSKTTEDVLSTILFAPKFREGIINTLFNTAKSVTTELSNPTFYKNRRLLGGMALTYALYNGINYKLNGNYMWDNEAGKKSELKVPLENGDYVYIPFMPSFLAFARNMAEGVIGTATGDFETATQKFGSLFSIPIKLVSELFSNKDYFGREIYNPDDSSFDKLSDIALYTGLQVNHPFVRELGRQIFTDKPFYQSVSEAMELPLKFKTKEQADAQAYYNALDEQRIKRKKAKDEFSDTYKRIRTLVEDGDEVSAQRILESLTEAQYEIYKDMLADENSKINNELKATVYSKYADIQRTIASGDLEKAEQMLYDLSDEEYKIYSNFAKQGLEVPGMSEEVDEEFGESKSETSFIKKVITYAEAIGSDPITAFDRIFSGQTIRRTDSGAIIVERIPFDDSRTIRAELGADETLRLDHTIPLQLGGSNDRENLKLVPTEEWETYTPVENYLGVALRDGKIRKNKAQALIKEFKSGRMTFDQIKSEVEK